METYTAICEVDSQWEFAVCLRKLTLKNQPRGVDGEGDGREVKKGEDIYIYIYYLREYLA